MADRQSMFVFGPQVETSPAGFALRVWFRSTGGSAPTALAFGLSDDVKLVVDMVSQDGEWQSASAHLTPELVAAQTGRSVWATRAMLRDIGIRSARGKSVARLMRQVLSRRRR